jgi:hypothetical protein
MNEWIIGFERQVIIFVNLKDCQIDMCCLSIKQEALWSKNRYCLPRNEDNVSRLDKKRVFPLYFCVQLVSQHH